MIKLNQKLANVCAAITFAATFAVAFGLPTPPGAQADEEYARNLVKSMSDYLAAQKAISFTYDAALDIVTAERQKLTLASSGAVVLHRPDKLQATRSGGFADVEMLFDGTTLTLLGKNMNRYAQVEIPGTIDNLVDQLREKYNKPLPAADLIMTDVYEQIMPQVIDVKDLGSGVIGGMECDHLAFRTKEVDWQIWIAQGDRPYPCRYAITSKIIAESPQYTIQLANWKTGDEVATDDFTFKNTTKAEKIALKDIPELRELPENFTTGDSK
jgi:hypothetical protein